MKITLALSLLALSLPCFAAPQMRDAAKHDDLVPAYRNLSGQNPMALMTPTTGSDPSTSSKKEDLMSQSDILCFGQLATLLPKRAVLRLPGKLAERLKLQPGVKFVSWMDFYIQNRGWIETVEISRAQAEGNVPLDEAVAKRVQNSSNLVVATYKGGPISLLPPKDNQKKSASNPSTDNSAKP